MNHSDFLVVGGGIAGISAAAGLAPLGSVVVLEGEAALGYHASGRSAAMLVLNYGNDAVRALNFASAEYLKAAGVLSPRGELMVATTGQEALLAEHASLPGMKHLSADEVCAEVPILRRDKVVAGLIDRSCAAIDVDALLQGFARQARTSGAVIVTGAKVSGLTFADGRWIAQTPKGEYSAPVLINAAGAWADQIAQLAGVKPLGIQPYRRSAALIPAPAGHDISKWPLFVAADESWYAKPEAGSLMVSPAEEDPIEAMDAWADDMALAEGIARYEDMVTEPVSRVTHSWAGLRSFAPDRTPVVGFDPGATGFFWLAGQGGYGVQTAPALSKLSAALITGAKASVEGWVIERLSPGRFG